MADDTHLIERAARSLGSAGQLRDGTAGLLSLAGKAAPGTVPGANPGAVPGANLDDGAAGPAPLGAPRAEEPVRLGESAAAATTAAATQAASLAHGSRPVISMAQLMAAGQIDLTQTRSRVAEEFRVVQGQVLRNAFTGNGANGAAQAAGNLVMVTSSRPGEGKTFAALNIAASIARQRDRRVVLCDIDSKPDALGAQLGLPDLSGLLDIAGQNVTDPETYLVPTALERLSFMPLGSEASHGPEVISSRQMARVIRDIGRRYSDRVVVLDAPPCLSSSDPANLASIVGQIIFVVEAERTQRPEVEAALDLIQTCPLITLLLNKVQLNIKHTFGGYASRYLSP